MALKSTMRKILDCAPRSKLNALAENYCWVVLIDGELTPNVFTSENAARGFASLAADDHE